MASELSNRTDEAAPSDLRARGIGARALLATAVAVPLIGLILATWPSVENARQVSNDAANLEATARNVDTLTRLDGALFDEMSLTIVRSLGEAFGIPPELTASVFGEDPNETLAASIATTDAIVGTGGLASIESRLDEIRPEPGGISEVQMSYGVIRADVRAALDTWIGDLGALPRVSSSELVGQIELLTAGIAMRSAIADGYYAYFTAVFDIRDTPATELARLIDARQRLDASMAEITTFETTDVEVAAQVEQLMNDPALLDLTRAMDDLIERSLSEGVPDRGLALTLENGIPLGDDLESVALGGIRSNAAALELIDGQAEAVVETTEAIRRDADRDTTLAYALAAALLAVSVVAVTIAGRFIAAPLRRLEDEVVQLQTGQPADHARPVRGPREVQAATATLRRASDHFSLATEQARRLAAGELDAAVLDERAEGGLGDSLQAAVDRLREALAHQNEFRRRLSHEASHDGLTQIPNRNASLSQLTRALARVKRSDSSLAVLFIDLDNFKDINDHHGHHAGDAVLTQVAQRLVNGAREGDFVGRLGGDEFLVIVEPVAGPDTAVELAERLLTAFDEPVALLDGEVYIRASVGVAVAEAVHMTAEEILRDADLAVYRAKSAGRGGVEVCDEELRNQFVQDSDLAVALERAVANDEFLLHYQPIVGADDHAPRAVEALVRWQRPDSDQLVPPALFIEFAERSLLIVDIDRWVMEAVARQLAAWQHDPDYAGIPVSVNISGRHLTHPQLVDHVLEPLQRHGVDPALLIVEVTESALVNDLALASTALGQLRDRGVRIAIDDFGTGYTSLAHLRALPVDILKIDRSFTAGAITDAGEASIVKLIIDAGHLLGATVTAEGIETVAEAQRLVELGTDSLQGYYFARPSPADRLFGPDLVSTSTATAD